MKSGIIGYVSGDFDGIQSETSVIDQGGTALQRCIDVKETFSLESGREMQVGKVAREDKSTREEVKIEDGEIVSEEETIIETDEVPFAAIPGEVVILGTGGGMFGFDLIGRQVEALIERASIDLDRFVSHHDDSTFWQYGFYDTGLNAENGVFYGRDLGNDKGAQTFINSSSVNQVGLDFLYGDTPVKFKMAESGYVEVYQPEDWDTAAYVDFLADEILPYVSSP